MECGWPEAGGAAGALLEAGGAGGAAGAEPAGALCEAGGAAGALDGALPLGAGGAL